MNSRVINSPTLNFDKKIKPLTIKTSSDVLSIKNMTKHKSQEAYIQKSISKDKIKNKQLIIENKKVQINFHQNQIKINKHYHQEYYHQIWVQKKKVQKMRKMRKMRKKYK